MWEEWADQVADEADPVLRQPDDTAVDRLAARSGDELEIAVADPQPEPLLEGDVRCRCVLGRGHPRVGGGDRPGLVTELEPDGRRGPSQAADSLIIALASSIVGLSDVLCRLVAERAHTTEVVDMALGRDDVRRLTR